MATLHLTNDGNQKIVARSEVVQQHPMAGTDRGGNVAQRPITDAAGGELVDQRIEKLLTPRDVRNATHERAAVARCEP